MALSATSIANLLVQKYKPGFALGANEESVFTKYCDDATGRAGKMANQINIRILGGGLTGQTIVAGGSGLTLTDTSEAGSSVNATPTFIYNAAYLSLPALSRLAEDGPAAEAAYKAQLMASVMTKIDTTGTNLAQYLTTSVEGGAVTLDQALMTKCLKDLITQGKDHFGAGKRAVFLIHPAQSDALLNIPTITAANIRGDSVNPIPSGWVWDAWNCKIEESGNVYSTGGIAYNMLFIPGENASPNAKMGTFAVAYNMKPQPLDPQPVEAQMRFITVAEVGFVEVFDYDGVLMKTNSV